MVSYGAKGGKLVGEEDRGTVMKGYNMLSERAGQCGFLNDPMMPRVSDVRPMTFGGSPPREYNYKCIKLTPLQDNI